MNQIEIFSSSPMPYGSHCVIYRASKKECFMPFIFDGNEALAIKEWMSGDSIGKNVLPVFVLESAIHELGANIMYSEIRRSDGGIIEGRLVCRQQNEINKIFSMIEVPASYALILGEKLYVDDETMDAIGFDDAAEVADLIGIDNKEDNIHGKEA